MRSSTSDAIERRPPHREISPVEQGADAEEPLRGDVRQRRDRPVVGTNQQSSPQVPIVKAVRSSDSDDVGVPLENPLDAFEPRQRRAAIRIEIDEHIPACGFPPGLTSASQPLPCFIHDRNALDPHTHCTRRIRACVVDDNDLVRETGLGEHGVEARRKVALFVIGADNHAHCHRHRAPRLAGRTHCMLAKSRKSM